MTEPSRDQPPDVLAMDEGVARERLEGAGFADVRVVVSAPPWPGEGQGPRRVLRQSLSPEGVVELVVAHARYEGRERGGR